MTRALLMVFLAAVSASASLATGQAATPPQSPQQQTTRPAAPQSPQQQTRPAAPQASSPAPASTPPAAAQQPASFLSPYDRDALTPEYRIAPGDVLHIFVWKEGELSREVRVRPDGYVTVPLLGDLFAVAKTPKGLAAELTQAYGAFVTAPLVTVTLGESSALRFYVVGEVNKPGEFPLLGRTTLMQALALAGGFREYAKTEEVKILRQELGVSGGATRTRELMLPINYKALAQGQNLHQNFAIKPGDVIVVP